MFKQESKTIKIFTLPPDTTIKKSSDVETLEMPNGNTVKYHQKDLELAREYPRIAGNEVRYGCRTVKRKILDQMIAQLEGNVAIMKVKHLVKIGTKRKVLAEESIVSENDEYFISKSMKAYPKNAYELLEKNESPRPLSYYGGYGQLAFQGNCISRVGTKNYEYNWERRKKEQIGTSASDKHILSILLQVRGIMDLIIDNTPKK